MAVKSKEIKKSNRGGVRPGAGRPKKELPQNRSFEEALPSYNRPTLYLTSIESKKELQAWDRIKLLNDARWLVNNSAIAARIVRGISRYAVGNGLVPQARTSNHAWNKQVEQLFEDRVANDAFAFDKAAQVNFYQAQRMIVEQMICDGEMFAQLAESQEGNAMARFITAEYVGSPLTLSAQDGFVDGVKVNDDNRPVAYRIVNDPMNPKSSPQDITADDIIHVRKIHRYGFQRGITWLCATKSLIQDLREMIDNEQLSAKMNTKVGLVIESPDAGNLSFGASVKKLSRTNIGGSAASDGSSSTATSNQSEESINFDRLVSGVGNIQLKPGEKLSAHEFDRPNLNFAPWTEFIVRSIAWSAGCSPELLWNFSGVGGAVTRHILQDSEVFFTEIRQLLEYQFCRRFWKYWVWKAIKNGDLEYPGDDWWRSDWIAPQRLTVDTGRDGALRLNLVRSGLLSESRYFAELGQDAEKETEDIIRGYARKKKMVDQIAAEEGVELNMLEVFPPAPGSPMANAPVEPDGDEEDDDAPPAKTTPAKPAPKEDDGE